MDVAALQAFLKRVNYKGRTNVSHETLKELHKSYVFSVPFENLDIHCNVPLSLHYQDLFNKIVLRERGGYCYELNSLFYYALKTMGFSAHLCLSRLANDKGNLLPDSVHMVILIELEQRYLADVGWGEGGFIYPLCLDEKKEQYQKDHAYLCSNEGDVFSIWRKDKKDRWAKLYDLTLDKRDLEDFQERNHYHQVTIHSPFSKERICIKPTKDGYISLRGDQLKYATQNAKETAKITNNEGYRRILKRDFNLHLDINLPILFTEEKYNLRSPRNRTEWRTYHRIRKEQIHDRYNSLKPYVSHDVEEWEVNHFPLVFTPKSDEDIFGTLRIDLLNDLEASLRWIAIDAPFTGQGLGKKMLSLAENFLQQRNITLVRIPVEPDSKDFYAHLGYTEMFWPNMPHNAGPISMGKRIPVLA
ncbi:MAG: GNAT family N-acetyltransferase [Alphaproteobacteria bacterium]|nr:GNAT family N-acetyltransferase [Alphaproteobacteria bacterium]